MALSPARYGPGLLHPVPPPPMLNREPTPKQDSNSDNDGKRIIKAIPGPFRFSFALLKKL